MKTKIVNIDRLAKFCGHYTEETLINNRYGCNHPEQRETRPCYANEYGDTCHADEDNTATGEQGCCYSFSCPLAHRCEFQDIEEYAPEMKEEYADDDECDAGELVVYHYENGDKIGEQL